jgi:type I restriction enzyme, S subunit
VSGEPRVGELTADYSVGRARAEAVTRQAETGADLLARILKYRDSIAQQRPHSRRATAETDTPANDALPQLPDGWVWARLDEIADIKGGITKDQKRNPDNCDFLPYLRVANVQRGYLDLSEIKEIPVPKEEVESLLLEPGDVLFNEGGDRDKLGRGWVWNGQIRRCVFQNHVFRARFHLPGSMEPKFISWYANTFGQDYFMAKGKQTTNLASINKTMFSAFPVPVAPLDHQQRIVAEIEKQFSRLDEAVTNLKRVKANLKRYKAAVLKAAAEGCLVETEAELARREGRSFETGEQLLQRILETRRSQWKGKGKYKEPAAPDTTDLPELPKGWVWATVEQLAAPEPNSITDGPFGSNLKTVHYQDCGPRVIRLQNVKDGEFADEPAHISDAHFERLRKHEIHAGDLVIASLGDNPPRACIIPSFVGPAIVKADCIRFKPHSALAAPYLNAALNCEPTRRRVKKLLHGIGRPRLSLGEVRAIVLPVPPPAEQLRIVAEVDRRLSVVRETETQVDADLRRGERLRQSILSRAFYGGLVDGNDRDSAPAFLSAGGA